MPSLPYFPFFVNLSGAAGLVVGGGAVALRKAQKLLPYGPRLTVVAPRVLPALAALPGVTASRRPFAEDDLAGDPAFVIAASDDPALNQRVAALCRARRIPVNVADDPAACSFLFPALVGAGPLTVGISTAGASPTAAVWLKEQIAALLPESFGAILAWLEGQRPALKAAFSAEADRAGAARRLFEQCLALGRPLTDGERATVLAARPGPGQVALVGAGCGRADLITLRGAARLRRCDAVVYDDLIDPALLAMAPAGAMRLWMGKRAGRPSAPQAGITAALIDLAQQGKRVVRLKGGDPFVFGRGGEEAAALAAAGVPFEVVPGISSAIAIPGEAGIPVTQRGVSRAVHIITAHTRDGGEDFARYAPLDGTLVFLMGLGRLDAIAAGLIAGGKPPETPAAVVTGGSAGPCAAVRAPLSAIAGQAATAGIAPPAVIVVGDVAALNLFEPPPEP